MEKISVYERPERRKYIEQLKRAQNFPLVVITGVSGAGKSTIAEGVIEKLSKDYDNISELKLKTDRRKKPRDKEGDFTYLSPEQLQHILDTEEVVYQYDSRRESDDYRFAITKDELIQLEHGPVVFVMGKSGFSTLKYMHKELNVITINIHRPEEEIIKSISNRDKSQPDYKENIKKVKKNIVDFLGKPRSIYRTVINKDIEKTVQEILSIVNSYEDQSNKEIKNALHIAITETIQKDGFYDIQTFVKNYITREDGTIDEEKINEIVKEMNIFKRSHAPRKGLTAVRKNYKESLNKKDIFSQTRDVYIKVCRTLSEIGYRFHAEKLMIQLGETYESIQLEEQQHISKGHLHALFEDFNLPKDKKINTSFATSLLLSMPTFTDINVIKNGYVKEKFEGETRHITRYFDYKRDAQHTAARIQALLEVTDGIKIHSSTHGFGSFKIEFDHPITDRNTTWRYIEIDFIRDDASTPAGAEYSLNYGSMFDSK